MANANESIISGLNDHNGIICFRGLGPYLKFLVSVVDLGKINGSLPVEQWKVQTIILIFVLWVYVDVVKSFAHNLRYQFDPALFPSHQLLPFLFISTSLPQFPKRFPHVAVVVE
jgi:hypothetical protein